MEDKKTLRIDMLPLVESTRTAHSRSSTVLRLAPCVKHRICPDLLIEGDWTKHISMGMCMHEVVVGLTRSPIQVVRLY